MGVWLAVAQTNNDCPTKQQQSAIQASTSPLAAVSTIVAKPRIAVSPSRLDFGQVAVGATTCLTFTVQNLGSGTLSGFAITSCCFGKHAGAAKNLAASSQRGIWPPGGPIAISRRLPQPVSEGDSACW